MLQKSILSSAESENAKLASIGDKSTVGLPEHHMNSEMQQNENMMDAKLVGQLDPKDSINQEDEISLEVHTAKLNLKMSAVVQRVGQGIAQRSYDQE